MITGFIVPASRRARTSRPGSAPMYVRRWPRISPAPAELALALLAHGLGHLRLGDLRPVLLDDGRLVLAELLADRVELAAQDVLPLLLRSARLDVLADALPHLELCEPLALQAKRQ